jgi:NAD(P)-dependent dehydrogenase (short-subunit alcohol dehydrogenase family)
MPAIRSGSPGPPYRRAALPPAAANPAFPASDEAGYITGVVLPVDGGLST